MKKKTHTEFVCQSCGNISPKWLGKCPECGSWNGYVEEIVVKNVTNIIKKRSTPVNLNKIQSDESEKIVTGNRELDTVLGGGFVRGSVILLGGDPGIGKSTLALQILENLSSLDDKLLYVSGEESGNQIKLRAKRIGVENDKILFLSENQVEVIIEEIKKTTPKIVIIDSIQTVFSDELSSSPGSVGQIRECGAKLVQLAKSSNTIFFLIGHVTKEGTIAGPKVLEHLVDTVLYFEGGKGHPYRILRAVKNRYGSTNEIGVFEMIDKGLVEVTNPSEIFLSERPQNASGSAVTPSIEGTRPILVEIQALVSKCNFGAPRRTTIGLDSNRVSLLVAVLEKITGIQIIGDDIFMNVAGGVTIDEPAIDLGICFALVSSFLNKPIESDLVVFGEVGLTGEVRGVSQVELRISEAKKLGFKKCLLPKINLEKNNKFDKNSLELIGIKSVEEAIKHIF